MSSARAVMMSGAMHGLVALVFLAPDVVTARMEIPASGLTHVDEHVIYLNREGATLRPGRDDSSRDQSSLIQHASTIPRWDVSDSTWEQTVACVRELYGPYDVAITDEDPGEVAHIEAVIGGSPRDVGMPERIGGVSPFTRDCGVIDRAIVFVFTDALRNGSRSVCEVIAQEVGHSYGLDHELLASDPMTYLPYRGQRTFQDETVACGEMSPRPCGINGSTCRADQNSHVLLLERLGAGQPPPDSPPPALTNGLAVGCAASSEQRGLLLVLACVFLARRRQRLQR